MPKILLIESSGNVCSVALSDGNEVLAERSINEPNSHSTYLASFIEEVIFKSKVNISELDAVAIGGGPGSYTGLRIGCSLAKGICFGANIPLIACSNLRALAVQASLDYPKVDKILSLIDARRMDAYFAVFDLKMNTLINEQFVTIDEQLSVDYIHGEIVATGSGAGKWFKEFDPINVVLHSNTDVYASYLLKEALYKWSLKDFEDVAYFEPNYIKSVFVTKPKPKF